MDLDEGNSRSRRETSRQTLIPAKSMPFRVLRGQKSTSFEVSRPFNVTHNATASAISPIAESKLKSKRPVITISAPPGVEEDTSTFSTPRSAPSPPSAIAQTKSSSGHARRPLGFPFGHHHTKKDDAKASSASSPMKEEVQNPVKETFRSAVERPSPTTSLSPMLPSSMKFPVPPQQASVSRNGKGQMSTSLQQASVPGRQEDVALIDAFQSHSPSTTLSPTVSPHTATPSDLSDRSPTPKPTPARPARPTSLIIPNRGSYRRSTSSSAPQVPQSPSSTNSRQSIASLRVRSRRSSRSASPASPPPNHPLPSPPNSATFPTSSDAEGWSTDASTTIGGWTTDASSRIGSVGTIPSLASRRSTLASPTRIRANTIAAGHETKIASTRNTATFSSEDELGRAKNKHIRGNDPAYHLPSFSHGRYSEKDEKETERENPKEQSRDNIVYVQSQPESRPQTGDTTPTRDDTPTQSLRAAHDTYVRILREKHAAEKADLVKRIERLERDARRREREIKGLRWLVMNANTEGGGGVLSLEDQLIIGRLRSGSKASEFSHASSGRSRASSSVQGAERGAMSPSNSVEEGLIELQTTVGDFFIPTARSSEISERPGSQGSGRSLRRSNTMPDGFASSAAKRARRSSSPVLPNLPSNLNVPGGLGFDIPSIPGSDSDLSLVTLDSSSLPSLTTTNTTSSTLSIIPEVPSLPAKEESRRASKALKRMSASPQVSQSQSMYASNLKVGQSPSIEQVMDRTSRETSMQEVLKKLRAFGGST